MDISPIAVESNQQWLLVDQHNAVQLTIVPGSMQQYQVNQGQHFTLLGQQGEHYSLAGFLVAQRIGDDLEVVFEDGSSLLLKGYYDCFETNTQEPDQCSVTVANDKAAGHVIGSQETYSQPGIVYIHGDESALLDMLNGRGAIDYELLPLLGELAEPAAGPLLLTNLIPALAGLGVASALTGLSDNVVALNKIAAYADDNSNPQPTVEDYKAAGVTGVHNSNLAVINSAVDALVGAQVDSKSELQGVIDQANSVVPLSRISTGVGGFVIAGIATSDEAGRSVSMAGDVNGDGLADVIVGAPGVTVNGNASAGASYVVFGKADGTTVDLNNIVAGTGGFVINGVNAGDLSGHSVSNAGDVNGDGLDDLIIGAYRSDTNGTDTGSSYVVFGKADGTAVDLAAVAAGTGGFIIGGDTNRDRSGISVSSAGDINGDGLDDLIVGAYWADPNGVAAAGESYVVFGKSTTTAVDLATIASGTGGFVVNGVGASDMSGFSVDGAGDINGDGLDDLIIGANYSNANGTDSGQSYIVHGKTNTTAVELSDIVNGTGGFAITGAAAMDESGYSVSHAGDVNGDGLADVIIGAPNADPNGGDSGAAYVVYGKSNNTSINLTDIAAGTGGFVINGIANIDYAGYSVSAAGDVNGDGLNDVIVGAMHNQVNGLMSGASYVVFGKANGSAVELSDVVDGTGGIVINSVATGDQSGISVSGAGDVNGDGFADLIVGANEADNAVTDSGTSYVVFGGLGASATVGTVAADTLTGSSAADQLIGGQGNDTLASGGGADILRGGAGDDVLLINDAAFKSLDGGLGFDILRLDNNVSLDFSNIPNSQISDIEAIDLNGQGSTLKLTLDDVLSLPGSAAKNDLMIQGTASDTVDISGTNFTDSNTDVTVNGINYDIYTDSNVDASVRLLIEQSLAVI